MIVEPEDHKECARCHLPIEWGASLYVGELCYDCLKHEIRRIETLMRAEKKTATLRAAGEGRG